MILRDGSSGGSGPPQDERQPRPAHAEEPLSKTEMASRSTLYTTEILRLLGLPREPRVLDRESGRAELRSPTCGSRITLAVQLDPEGRVEALSQQVHACAFGQ